MREHKPSRQEVVSAVNEAYRALSPFSDKSRWEINSHVVHAEEIIARVSKDQDIIDVGSHIGILAIALRILGYNVSANDKYLFDSKEGGNAYGFTQEERAALKTIWSWYGLVVTAYDVLTGTPNKKYDVVVNIAVLEHQPYPREFVEGLQRFMKDDGILYLSTPNIARIQNRVRFLLGRAPVENIKEFYGNGRRFNGHWREYTVREVSTMLTLSGMSLYTAICKQVSPIFYGWNVLRNAAKLLGHMGPTWGDSVICVASFNHQKILKKPKNVVAAAEHAPKVY